MKKNNILLPHRALWGLVGASLFLMGIILTQTIITIAYLDANVIDFPLRGKILGSTISKTTYNAITDLNARALPPLPALGPAGSSFIDPTFGTRIYRVTDQNTNPGYSNYRCNTPASNEINTFNADSTLFYVRCSGILVYRLNPATRQFSVIMDPSKPSVPLVLPTGAAGEPEFSRTNPNVLYMTVDNKIQKYDFSTLRQSVVLDLKTVVPNLTGTAASISASDNEKICVVFNGIGDTWHSIVVYDVNAATTTLIDTQKATINGQPLNVPFSFGAHGSKIDKSGRYINITPGVWLDTTNKPVSASTLIVDLQTKQAQWLTYRSNGHRALGYGQLVNGEVPPNDSGPNILFRPLDFSLLNATNSVVSIMPGPNSPPYVGGADYISWNNARAGMNVPVIGVFYQKDTAPKFNGEIFAAATDGSKTVWRFAHHRAYAGTYDGSSGSFWNLARGNVSQDGRFMTFMSNWEKTLGTVVDGDRTDVFLLELKQESSVVPSSAPSIDTTPPVIFSITSAPTTTSATISWNTSKAADSQVMYGTSATALSSSSAILDTGSSMKTTHSMRLTNLTPGTIYYFKVKSKDTQSNTAVSSVISFKTKASIAADTSPPIISAVASSAVAYYSATITWTTNELSNSQVEYGMTMTPLTSSTALIDTDTSMKMSHTVYLSNLSYGSTYYYRTRSADAQGNLTVSSLYSFTTPWPPSPIQSFTATPSTITAGGSSVLQWSVTTNNYNLYANAQAIPVQGLTNIRVTPTSTTNYTLFASDSYGGYSSQVTVTVK